MFNTTTLSKNMTRFTAPLILCAVTGFTGILAGCGGSDTAPQPSGSAAAGFYTGTTSSGAAFNTVILPNNTSWTFYGQPRADGGMRAFGALSGFGTVVDNTYNSADSVGVLFDPTKGTSALGSATGTAINATFIQGSAIQGTVQTPGLGRLGFSATVPAPALYRFSNAADMTALVGRWNGFALNQLGAFIDVSPTGAFTGAVASCTYTGTLAAHPDKVNVFTSELTLGPAPCSAPGLVLKGVAVAYVVSSGKTELMVAGLTPNRSTGTLFYAQR